MGIYGKRRLYLQGFWAVHNERVLFTQTSYAVSGKSKESKFMEGEFEVSFTAVNTLRISSTDPSPTN